MIVLSRLLPLPLPLPSCLPVMTNPPTAGIESGFSESNLEDQPQLTASGDEQETGKSVPKASDSSILFKVTLRETALLIGQPVLVMDNQNSKDSYPGPENRYGVVQLVGNALIMFQSVENVDGSGSKTLHASMENLSAFAKSDFSQINVASLPAMIGPAAAEFRVAYATENMGSVVSQDFSLHCEKLMSSLTVNDVFVMKLVTERMIRRFQNFRAFQDSSVSKEKRRPSILRYHKKGTGIATSFRLEVQTVSFILLEAYRLRIGTRPLFRFVMDETKANLSGCVTAFSGDCTSTIQASHFNSETSRYDYCLEPIGVTGIIEQMPTEVVSPNRSCVVVSRGTYKTRWRGGGGKTFKLLGILLPYRSVADSNLSLTVPPLVYCPLLFYPSVRYTQIHIYIHIHVRIHTHRS